MLCVTPHLARELFPFVVPLLTHSCSPLALLPHPPASELLRSHVSGNKVLLITNDRISPLYLKKYQDILDADPTVSVETLVLPDGEAQKTIDVLGLILDKALECALDRKTTFVALGGGVIGDMVGFAAAIYQRGVNFIQVCAMCVT